MNTKFSDGITQNDIDNYLNEVGNNQKYREELLWLIHEVLCSSEGSACWSLTEVIKFSKLINEK